MPARLMHIGRAACHLQVAYGKFQKAVADLDVPEAMVIDGVPLFTEDDVELIGRYLRADKAGREAMVAARTPAAAVADAVPLPH